MLRLSIFLYIISLQIVNFALINEHIFDIINLGTFNNYYFINITAIYTSNKLKKST